MSGKFTSSAEAAKRLSVTPRTIIRWISDGHFPNAFQLNPGLRNSPYIIPTEEIDQFEKKRGANSPDSD